MAMAMAMVGVPATACAFTPTSSPFCSLPLLRRVARFSPPRPASHCSPFLRVGSHADRDLLGDFGARDPFPAEVESGFCNRVLGNASTEHVVLIPNSFSVGLGEKSCKPVSPGQCPLSIDDARDFLRKRPKGTILTCT
eukprot:c24564_g1_i2 orf=844-1257(-)